MVEKFGEGITSLVPTLYASSKGGQDSDKGVRMPPFPPPKNEALPLYSGHF